MALPWGSAQPPRVLRLEATTDSSGNCYLSLVYYEPFLNEFNES